ncbi:MAG: zinc ribbon domain-containing protein [Bacillota bacterium]|nr:zinc ribbon domain-containing protein [Bacillota bacterium]
MDSRAIKQWEWMSKMGRRKYIGSYITFGILLPVFDKLFKYGFHMDRSVLRSLLLQAVIFSICAYFIGRLSWRGVEKQVLRELDSKSLEDIKVDFCYYCGAKIEDDSKVCPECGRQLEQQDNF